MRLASVFSVGLFTALTVAADSGLPPRPNSSDYPVSKPTKTAVIGAVLVPADQVKKILPPEVSKKYLVVEVAVYPQGGAAVDVVSLDFALKCDSGEIRYASTPRDVATPWREREPAVASHPVQVHGETGVTYGSGNDPNTGRQRGWSTYEGVAVTNDNAPDAPPPPPYDPYVTEARIREKALPEGETSAPVAGYLFFPVPAKKSKKAAFELRYSKDGEAVSLPLPAK